MIRALERAGWTVDRQRGSHISMKKSGEAHLVVVRCTDATCQEARSPPSSRTRGLHRKSSSSYCSSGAAPILSF
ncbi:MAG: type II toxin-antitoxin system HicA family toxin [Dehalococcoidia bacterium]